MAIATYTFVGATAAEIIAADEHRDHITIQLQTASAPVYLAFDEDAVDATGILLLYPGCSVRVTGDKARQAVSGICATSNAVIGIETCEDVEYRPGSFAYGY